MKVAIATLAVAGVAQAAVAPRQASMLHTRYSSNATLFAFWPFS
jgi:hypothetical protein